MGGKRRVGALAIMLLLGGCYRTTPQAINEIANIAKPICPFDDGVYFVRSGTIDGSVIIATVVINSVDAKGGGKNCAAKTLVLDSKSAKSKVENIFTRRFSALDDEFQIAYQYPATDKPDINYIHRVGRLYEVYSECNSDINSACGVLKTANDIKRQSKYLVSTEKKRELFIRQSARVHGANEFDLVSLVQTPNYIIVPKFYKP
jgi:hypothetical protein